METVKKVRKPRQPKVEKPKVEKPKRTPKPKVEKPKRTPKPKVEKPAKAPVEFKNLDNDAELTALFLEDLDFLRRDTTKKMTKIMSDSKLSAEEKKKKTDRIINKLQKFLMQYAQDYDKHGDDYKRIKLEKERNFGKM